MGWHPSRSRVSVSSVTNKQQPAGGFSLEDARARAEQARARGDTDDVRLGRNIKAAREAKGMSQTELASYMSGRGFTAWRQTTVSRTERGERAMVAAEAWQLEELFGGRVLWEGTRFGASMGGLVDGLLESAIEEKFDAVERELGELREMLHRQRRRRDRGEHQ